MKTMGCSDISKVGYANNGNVSYETFIATNINKILLATICVSWLKLVFQGPTLSLSSGLFSNSSTIQPKR